MKEKSFRHHIHIFKILSLLAGATLSKEAHLQLSKDDFA
jgi:hypothetical protein